MSRALLVDGRRIEPGVVEVAIGGVFADFDAGQSLRRTTGSSRRAKTCGIFDADRTSAGEDMGEARLTLLGCEGVRLGSAGVGVCVGRGGSSSSSSSGGGGGGGGGNGVCDWGGGRDASISGIGVLICSASTCQLGPDGADLPNRTWSLLHYR